MKLKQLILSASAGLAVLVIVPFAEAVPINLGQTTGSPASPSDELTRLDGQISSYNSANSASLPTGTITGDSGDVTTGSGGTSITVNVSGWDYIVLKWADTDQYYYIGTTTGNYTFNSTVFNGNDQPQALSHYALFNPVSTSVPDGGSTALLLGAAMSGLGLVVRRIKSA